MPVWKIIVSGGIQRRNEYNINLPISLFISI
jgi:hypothetical protein